MRNYQNGKIYTVRSRSRLDLVYVGSTIQPLSVRMGMHKTLSNRCSSKQVIEIGDAYIELIENYPCSSVEELLSRENHYIRSMVCVNKQLAISECSHGRSQTECKDCHGSGICEHNRRRRTCKDCHGSGMCEHNKRRDTCKNCTGTSICRHNHILSSCRDCGGASICRHHLEISYCKKCSPKECEFCEITTSKGVCKRHLKSQRHKTNYKAEFLRVFGEEITDDEVPLF